MFVEYGVGVNNQALESRAGIALIIIEGLSGALTAPSIITPHDLLEHLYQKWLQCWQRTQVSPKLGLLTFFANSTRTLVPQR